MEGEIEGCNCQPEMVVAIQEMVRKKHPEASKVQVEMGGYGYTVDFKTGSVRYVPCFPVTIKATVPKAKGDGTKVLRLHHSGIATFCPFCGKRYPPTASADPSIPAPA